jgi:hypothetical protein
MSLKEFQFQVPLLEDDGVTPIPSTDVVAYSVLLDTVNPPVKSYAVPASAVVAAVAGLVTVTFAELGFVPVNKTTYFADATATDGGTSLPSNMVSFTYVVTPAAPTGFRVG